MSVVDLVNETINATLYYNFLAEQHRRRSLGSSTSQPCCKVCIKLFLTFASLATFINITHVHQSHRAGPWSTRENKEKAYSLTAPLRYKNTLDGMQTADKLLQGGGYRWIRKLSQHLLAHAQPPIGELARDAFSCCSSSRGILLYFLISFFLSWDDILAKVWFLADLAPRTVVHKSAGDHFLYFLFL